MTDAEHAYWLAEALHRDETPNIVAVGANPVSVGADSEPYYMLVRDGLVNLHAFEPQLEPYAKLEAAKLPSEHICCAALGPEGSRPFYSYVDGPGGFSSLYAVDPAVMSHFRGFGRIARSQSVDTIPYMPIIDLLGLPQASALKIELQSADISVIQSGCDRLADLDCLTIELPSINIHTDAPNLSVVDQALRAKGFVLHKLLLSKSAPFDNSRLDRLRRRQIADQLLDEDAVYIRDIANPPEVPNNVLKRITQFADGLFQSFSLCLRAIDLLVATEICTADLPGRYADALPDRVKR